MTNAQVLELKPIHIARKIRQGKWNESLVSQLLEEEDRSDKWDKVREILMIWEERDETYNEE